QTGLYFYRARYYDPVLKQFSSQDPAGIDAGINLRSYVDGNPVSFTDPSGKFLNFVGGALIGAGLEITMQAIKNYRQGCDLFDTSNYDWFDVGAAAAFGAVAPGFLLVGNRTVTSLRAMRNLSGQLDRARTANRINKIEQRIAAHEAGILEVVIPQVGFQGAKELVKQFKGDRELGQARCKAFR